MNFQHHPDIWKRFPQLSACAVWARGIQPNMQAEAALDPLVGQARELLKQAGGSEGQLPAVQAWRRGFSELGLKPTQYRCAAESLLRRLRQDGNLPRVYPLVDTFNALSVAHAIPIAVFDLSRVQGRIEVRLATGTERFISFSGEEETPEPVSAHPPHPTALGAKVSHLTRNARAVEIWAKITQFSTAPGTYPSARTSSAPGLGRSITLPRPAIRPCSRN